MRMFDRCFKSKNKKRKKRIKKKMHSIEIVKNRELGLPLFNFKLIFISYKISVLELFNVIACA
jgi:hypothetical protein